MSNPPRVVLFGLLMGGIGGLAFIAAGLLRVGGDVRVPVTAITALLLLASKPIADRLATWTGAPRPPVVSALSALSMAPLLFLGALIAMGDPIVSSHWRCGTGELEIAMLSPFGLLLLGATGALFACLIAGQDRRRVNALLGAGRLVALALSALLVAGAAIRAARHPDPDHYLDTLPQVGVIPPVSGKPIAIIPAPANSSTGEETHVYEDRVGDLVIHRECTMAWCQVALGRADEPRPADTQKWRGVGMDQHASRVLTRDEKHDLWVIGNHTAFRGPDFRLTDINVGTVADTLSPPMGWTLGAGIGLLLAAGLQVRRRRLMRRKGAIESAVAGVHTRNGWITVDDSLPAFRAAPDLALPEGAVLVVSGQGAAGGYRGDGAARGAEILAGTREEHVAGLRERIAALDALAMAAAGLTAAPLVAAWVRGLLLSLP